MPKQNNIRINQIERDFKELLENAEKLGELKAINRVGMIRATMGWLIGYFVIFYPLRMWLSYSLVGSLLHSIFGVGVAVIFMWLGRHR